MKRGEQGFTMIELIMTMTIIAIGTTAVVGIFIGIGTLDQHARHLASATQQVQIKIESYRNQSYNSITTGSPALDFTSSLPTDLPSPRSGIVNITESPTGLKLIEIKITYTEGKQTKKVEASTYVSQHGVGR